MKLILSQIIGTCAFDYLSDRKLNLSKNNYSGCLKHHHEPDIWSKKPKFVVNFRNCVCQLPPSLKSPNEGDNNCFNVGKIYEKKQYLNKYLF